MAGFLEDRDTELMCPKTVGELMEHLTEQNNTLKEQVNESIIYTETQRRLREMRSCSLCH